MLSALMAASYTTRFWTFALFYSVVFPLGMGLVYFVPVIAGWEWFPEKRGTVSGVIIGGFGLGAFFFGFLTTAIANPDNLEPHTQAKDGDTYFPDSVAKNVPKMIRTCCIFWTALCVIGILTISRNPAFVAQEKLKERMANIE